MMTTNIKRTPTAAQGERARAASLKSRQTTREEMIQSALASLPPNRQTAIRDRARQIPRTCLATYLKAVKGRSPGLAIKAHCLECVGWKRNEVSACTAPACPLFPYRPYQTDD